MRCERCHHDNAVTHKFCGECGAPLALRCAGCGSASPPGQKFCGECGRPIAAPAPAPIPRFAAPDTYTPRDLAERILEARASVEGERKQVTVLFADLKGSLEIIADRDPEDAREILDHVIERMMEAVHRYDGTVNHVMGDGIMAIFGAPLAHEDHALRASYAALRMQESVKDYADEVRRARGIAVRIRVGLNSGEVVVRTITSDLRMDYTAVGQTTHLAARMEQLADPGAILLSQDTARLVEGFVELRALGPTPVKGLQAPVDVFEATGAGPIRSRLRAAALRGLTRLVGREHELEQLERALDRAGQGHGQVVAVVGEPGVGKSRLCWELTHSSLTRGWLVLEASAQSFGRATAFRPIVELLQTYFQIDRRDTTAQIRDKVAARLAAPELAPDVMLPALLALLEAPPESPAWERLEPAERRQRTLEAVRRLLLHESFRRPVLVLMEDLHWIDPETQSLLDGVVDSMPAARLLLLVSYRPEYQHAWSSKTYYRHLHIEPLTAAVAEGLLTALVGSDVALRALKALLIERTEGNPFFMEESVRALVANGALVGTPGAYRLASPEPRIQVPATVQAVLAARIDRLSREEKHLLQSAAVIGRDVPLPLLQRIADLADEPLRRGLARLQAAELIYEKQLFPDLEFTFTHALTHEVAYGSMLHARRRALHVRILEAMEALHSGHLAEHVESLADHATRGEAWDKAFTYLRQAGARAFARAAHRSAVEWFERALEVLERLPDARALTDQAIDLRLDLRYALVPLGQFKRIFDNLAEAERLATEIGDERRLALVHAFLTNYFQITGDPERAVDYGERALASAEARGDRSVQVLATAYLGATHFVMGNYPRAVELSRRNIATLTADIAHERFGMALLPAVYSRTALVRSLAETGRFPEAMGPAEESIGIAAGIDDPVSLSLAHFGVGYVCLRQGAHPQAIGALRRALDLSRAANIIWFQQIASTLASAYVGVGRAAEALDVLTEAAQRVSGIGSAGRQLGHGIRLAAAGEVSAALGRHPEAAEQARGALEVFEGMKAAGYAAWAHRLLGVVHAACGGEAAPALAEQAYGRAMALADGLGMRPLVARCQLDRGELYARTGRRERARADLTAAVDLFSAMEMASWFSQARRLLVALD